MKGFDGHLSKLLKAHPKMAREYAKLLAELPVSTQQAILRRRWTKKRAADSDMPIGKMKRIKDFLPSPKQLRKTTSRSVLSLIRQKSGGS